MSEHAIFSGCGQQDRSAAHYDCRRGAPLNPSPQAARPRHGGTFPSLRAAFPLITVVVVPLVPGQAGWAPVLVTAARRSPRESSPGRSPAAPVTAQNPARPHGTSAAAIQAFQMQNSAGGSDGTAKQPLRRPAHGKSPPPSRRTAYLAAKSNDEGEADDMHKMRAAGGSVRFLLQLLRRFCGGLRWRHRPRAQPGSRHPG